MNDFYRDRFPLPDRLEWARKWERTYTDAGNPVSAAKWARYARYIERLIERKGL